MQEGALALEHFRHEQADRLGQRQDHAEEDEDLQNANGGHGDASKLLGLEHGPPEVHEQEDRHETGSDVVKHFFYSEFTYRRSQAFAIPHRAIIPTAPIAR
jgi:hypothetical protein